MYISVYELCLSVLLFFLIKLQANTSGVSLQNANAIFVSKRLKLKKEYENIVRNVYYSDVGVIDFSDTYNASAFINNWINEHTKGLIPHLVQPCK